MQSRSSTPSAMRNWVQSCCNWSRPCAMMTSMGVTFSCSLQGGPYKVKKSLFLFTGICAVKASPLKSPKKKRSKKKPESKTCKSTKTSLISTTQPSTKKIQTSLKSSRPKSTSHNFSENCPNRLSKWRTSIRKKMNSEKDSPKSLKISLV